MKTLDSNIKHLEQKVKPHYIDVFTDTERHIIVQEAELFRLSIRLYLLRAGFCYPISHPVVSATIDAAYNLLLELKGHSRTWPLFMIGSEARTDMRRKQIIRMFENRQRSTAVVSLGWIQRITEKVWLQDDLFDDVGSGREEALDGQKRLTVGISTCGGLPTFA